MWILKSKKLLFRTGIEMSSSGKKVAVPAPEHSLKPRKLDTLYFFRNSPKKVKNQPNKIFTYLRKFSILRSSWPRFLSTMVLIWPSSSQLNCFLRISFSHISGTDAFKVDVSGILENCFVCDMIWIVKITNIFISFVWKTYWRIRCWRMTWVLLSMLSRSSGFSKSLRSASDQNLDLLVRYTIFSLLGREVFVTNSSVSAVSLIFLFTFSPPGLPHKYLCLSTMRRARMSVMSKKGKQISFKMEHICTNEILTPELN